MLGKTDSDDIGRTCGMSSASSSGSSSGSSSSLDIMLVIVLFMIHGMLLIVGNWLMLRTTWNVLRMFMDLNWDFERYNDTIYHDWTMLFYLILVSKIVYCFYEQYVILMNSSGLSSGENPYLGKGFFIQVMLIFSVMTSSIPTYFLVWLQRMLGEMVRFQRNTSSETSDVLSYMSPVKRTMRWMGYETVNSDVKLGMKRREESVGTPTRVSEGVSSVGSSSNVLTPVSISNGSGSSLREGKNGLMMSRLRKMKKLSSSFPGVRSISTGVSMSPTKTLKKRSLSHSFNSVIDTKVDDKDSIGSIMCRRASMPLSMDLSLPVPMAGSVAGSVGMAGSLGRSVSNEIKTDEMERCITLGESVVSLDKCVRTIDGGLLIPGKEMHAIERVN